MSREQDERRLSTADFAAATESPQVRQQRDYPGEERGQQDRIEQDGQPQDRLQHEDREIRDAGARGTTAAEPLAELFPTDLAAGFRERWDAVQIGFVDDPKQAVQQADELVAQVMKSLAESFSKQRASIESDVAGADQASTENLRVALRRYRSFFQRLLSL